MKVYVALLAEGVDRNNKYPGIHRRVDVVALLAEGVDRNGYSGFRAWFRVVALLAEGVDRNFLVHILSPLM